MNAQSISVSQLIDREAIRALVAQYSHIVWQKDLEGYVSLFTEDGKFAISDSSLAKGASSRDELRVMMRDSLAELDPRPFNHQHVVELTNESAAKGTAYQEIRVTQNGRRLVLAVIYNDDYVKIDGKWLFKARRLTVDSVHPLPT